MIGQVTALQLFSTLFMLGLIWFVQIVHYPLFALVGDSRSYYVEHQRRTSWIVLPIMSLELVCASALFWVRSSHKDQVGLILVIAIWLSTITLQVPCHRKLLTDYSVTTVKRLTRTNWLRTFLWSLRALILLLL